MIDLHKFLTNPFDDPAISMDELIAFGTDHLQRIIKNNSIAAITARIAATTTALTAVSGAYTDDKTKAALRKAQKQTKDAFRRSALPDGINRIYGVVLTKYGAKAPQMTECFPQGRNIFNSCTDGDLEEELQTLINGLTNHQTDLGAQVVTDATGLLNGWTAVNSASGQSSGAKVASKVSKTNARANLQAELFTNLLTIALNCQRQPEQLDIYMQQSLLEPHTQSTSTPDPTPTPAPSSQTQSK